MPCGSGGFADQLGQSLLNTGAFEISYEGTPIWSKIETGRFPSAPELISAVRATCSG